MNNNERRNGYGISNFTTTLLNPGALPWAVNFIVDEVEERIYFDHDGEMQAWIDRENEEVVFQYQEDEDWYLADTTSFEEINERNEAPIF